MNRTIVEKASYLLIEAGLEKCFWAEAVTTAVYLINRSPSRKLEDDKTPKEMRSMRKPNLKHLRTFGCIAMVHIPSQKRKKLDSKSVRSIMVGYSENSKAYRVYDPIKKQVLISRDVIFLEDECYKQVTEYDKQNIDNFVLFHILPTVGEGGNIPINGDGSITAESAGIPDQTAVTGHNKNVEERRSIQGADLNVCSTSADTETKSNRFDNSEVRITGRSVKPKKFDDYVTYFVSERETEADPNTFEEAISRGDFALWRQAMDEEYASLIQNNTWEVANLPIGKKPLQCKWVYKRKRKKKRNYYEISSSGSVENITYFLGWQ